MATGGATHSGRMGFELFDKSSWGQTEFDEKVNYQRAMEGELERTISTLGDVKSARVHLVMPTSSVFLDRERGAKASVTLRMKHGGLSADELHSIARLVSSAVDDLAPRDVTIVDADSNESLSGKSGGLEGRELEGELTSRLLETLGPTVGAENLRASVNVEYDLSSTEESHDKYDPAVSAVLTSQKTREQIGAGPEAGGVAGTAANLPNAESRQPQAVQEDNSQLSSSENSTFGVNKVITHTVSPAGRIRRITAAILVNDAIEHKQVKGRWLNTPHKRTQAQLDQLAELARSVVGADKDRGDLVTVQNMSFRDQEPQETSLTLFDRLRVHAGEFSSPLRYVLLIALFLLVWALMFRPIQRELIASVKELGPGPAIQALTDAKAFNSELVSAAAKPLLETDPETATMKRDLNELVLAEPAAMTRTLQSWLRESKG